MADSQTLAAPLLLRDLRSRNEPMRSFTVKLPTGLIDALDQYAATHHAPRSSVARTLLAEGLEQLTAATG